MFNNPFYLQTIRNTIVVFGSLFSNLTIQRRAKDGTNTILQTVNVPLAYANKEKEIVRSDGDPNLDNNVQITVPRMSFEITGYEYDASRKLNAMGKLTCNSGATNARKEVFTPVPWNMNITLDLLTKNQEDALQIIEQILPLFKPEYNLVISTVPEMNIISDVPLILNSLSATDTFSGSFDNSRLVVHTFNFTAKMNLYTGFGNVNVIKKVTANVTTDLTFINKPKETYIATGTVPGAPITDIWIDNL